MFQFPHHEFDHNGVVEKSDARNVIRDQVLRLGEIGQGVEYAGRFTTWQAPFVGVPTEEEDLAIGFVEDSGLKDVKLTPDIEVLKEAFPFQDTPYAVAIENGRVSDRAAQPRSMR